MEEQTEFYSHPARKARVSDPDTSREAAEHVVVHTMKPSNKDVLLIASTHYEFTQRDLEEDRYLNTRYSPSRIRTAVSELRSQGLVVDTGRRMRFPSGRKAIIWKVIR